jgi:membrane associated rhomboid family serine protease
VLRAPSIVRLPAFPATGGLILVAVAASLASWNHHGLLYNFTADPRAFHGEPWRLFTSALPHADFFHLAFNLYWTWVFGTLIEEKLGHVAAIGLYVLLAVVPIAAEVAVFDGGIGLSGVGYGLFGMMWALSSRDRRFTDAVDASTIRLFLAWGVLCVVLTVTDVLPVANVAHGMGLVLGLAVGRAIAGRRVYWIAAVALAGVSIAFAGPLRPYVNLSRDRAAATAAYAAQLAADSNKPALAAAVFRDAVALGGPYAGNVGQLEEDAGELGAARVDYRTACDLGDHIACTRLGALLELGHGGPVDAAGAAELYEKACALGDAYGCADRGRQLETTEPARAKVLLERGCAGGVSDACTHDKQP